MEQTFQMGYKEGEKVLFVLLTIGKVKRSLYQAFEGFMDWKEWQIWKVSPSGHEPL